MPYSLSPVAFQDVKGPEYTAVNPNGRVPAIEDPNTGIIMFEVGCIPEIRRTTKLKQPGLAHA